MRRNFEADWGIKCNALAEIEGVTPEAIRMRIKNFGTPFQRRGKKTKFEEKYGKTLPFLAHELNLHPQTIARREHLYGDVYHVTKWQNGLGGRVTNDRGLHWSVNPKMYHIKEANTHMTHEEMKDKLDTLSQQELDVFVYALEQYENQKK
tara:strand:+ start:1300 stop:1749 length:450 start_codon:yes stop_codon:yes gene_type:complete